MMFKFKLALLTITTACMYWLAQTGMANAQTNTVYLHSSTRYSWKVTPADEVKNTGELMQPGFNTVTWVNAVVPGTVFNSYVVADIEKDPNFGDNIQKVDRKKYDRSYWYRLEFAVPAQLNSKNLWLNFRGVNRNATIYLNGQQLGKLDGFMERGMYNITPLVQAGKPNVLAVLVAPPVHPLANYGSPNYVSSGGWDWMPYVPGLNSGITDKVYLSTSGDFTLEDPWVRSDLPTNARADLSVAVTVRNHSANQKLARVTGTIMPGNITFTKNIWVNAHYMADVKLDKKDFEQLAIHNPQLWWPNGYGKPNLYQLNLKVSDGETVADERNITFGIKRYDYDTLNHVFHIKVNGVPVFVKGGNWGMSEYMLRCRDEEYDTKVRLHKEMNFNMIRNWIGSTTDDEFYEACDKYGIMIWDEFWLNSNPGLPASISTFNANAVEKIKRVRNHPSIAVWCADNEGWPDAPLDGWLREDIKTFDGGDRHYQSNSHADGLSGSGPWGARPPKFYFTKYPVGSGGTPGWGFRTEIGTAVFVNIESFKKFMPQNTWWPRNPMWETHMFGQWAFNADPDGYEQMLAAEYGKPAGIEDFCRKAQFLNLETNKAMYEGWLDHIGEDASGVMTWMSANAYPSLIWQTFDYYYDLTGAYFGARQACEPLHIQWNPVTHAIKVVNTTRADVNNLTAQAELYNLDGTIVKKYTQKAQLNAFANTATEAFRLALPVEGKNIAAGKAISASSADGGAAYNANDGNDNTRWASRYNDDEWLSVDLGGEEWVNGVALTWEDAYAQNFKIEVSTDNQNWTEVYNGSAAKPGLQKIGFANAKARYVRMHGVKRATTWGYSLWNFEVYQGALPDKDLTDVHFIKLKLTDAAGKPVSENFYWRGNGSNALNYTALNTLPRVALKLSTKTVKSNGKAFITAQVSNPSAKAIAFGVRLKLADEKTGELILPAIISDNYFTLLPNETKTVLIEVDDSVLKNKVFKLIAEPYNNYIVKQ